MLKARWLRMRSTVWEMFSVPTSCSWDRQMSSAQKVPGDNGGDGVGHPRATTVPGENWNRVVLSPPSTNPLHETAGIGRSGDVTGHCETPHPSLRTRPRSMASPPQASTPAAG